MSALPPPRDSSPCAKHFTSRGCLPSLPYPRDHCVAAYALEKLLRPRGSISMARDKLLVKGLRLFGRHGVLSAEQTLGQMFHVDVEVKTNIEKPGRTDDYSDASDYVRIFETAKQVVEGRPRQLVESVATDIAEGVLNKIPLAQAVRVRVLKPHVALPAQLDGIGVELERTRDDF